MKAKHVGLAILPLFLFIGMMAIIAHIIDDKPVMQAEVADPIIDDKPVMQAEVADPITVTYKDLMRNADSYAGQTVTYEGYAWGVTRDGDKQRIFLSARPGMFNVVQETHILYQGPRILEGDHISGYGTVMGFAQPWDKPEIKSLHLENHSVKSD